jgi:hypothetical protein
MMRKLVLSVTFAVAAATVLVTCARAFPAIESHVPLICGEALVLGLNADPKAAGTPIDFIVFNPEKIPNGAHAIRVIKGEIFIGDVRC